MVLWPDWHGVVSVPWILFVFAFNCRRVVGCDIQKVPYSDFVCFTNAVRL